QRGRTPSNVQNPYAPSENGEFRPRPEASPEISHLQNIHEVPQDKEPAQHRKETKRIFTQGHTAVPPRPGPSMIISADLRIIFHEQNGKRYENDGAANENGFQRFNRPSIRQDQEHD